MVDKNKTELVCILDRSGSMQGIWEDMIGGLDNLIKDHKETPGETLITIAVFDSEYSIIAGAEDIKKFDLTRAMENVRPRGCTALLDAVGRTINSIGARFSKMKEEERPGNVIFSIITDGYENASKEFSYEGIKKMITHQQEKYQWVFTYLGANQDAFGVGDNLGIGNQFCANFDTSTSKGVQATYASISNVVSRCRACGPAAAASSINLESLYEQNKAKDKDQKSNEQN